MCLVVIMENMISLWHNLTRVVVNIITNNVLGRINSVPDVSHEASYNFLSTNVDKFILSYSGYSCVSRVSISACHANTAFLLNFADLR